MTDICSAVDFYARHPISAEIILAKLKEARGYLDGVRPEELFAHDQDHYGGLAVNDILAARAEIKAGSRVADFCAGLGGPARYLAHKYGADVTGIELTPARVAGAQHLTQLVGLQDKVRLLQGDVMQVPLPDAGMDAVISQEAFLHVPDLRRAFAEARRILRPGGRFAFTNWVAERPLSEPDRQLMWDGMAVAASLRLRRAPGAAGGRGLLRRVGGGSDRRVGAHPRAAARHVPQAARRGRAGRHAGWLRSVLSLLRAPGRAGAGGELGGGRFAAAAR
jgi:SAM-dependent methyltransferase